MHIAFTHNLQINDSEEQAEFDRPETVGAICGALRRLGHTVEPVEVSGTASRVVARLEALNPDLVFNTAEGSRGRFREAFYPALFDRLGIPFTGSDAYVCALTLDKHLTKMMLASHGVPVPRGFVVMPSERIDARGLTYPLFVKPNHEGSSMGISRDSLVRSDRELEARVAERLARFPAGVLVEEFIPGRDVTVPFLEKASPETGGVLEPAAYSYAGPGEPGDALQIYDYDLKSVRSDQVCVQVPAGLSPETRRELLALSRKVIRVLGVRDMARLDFRVDVSGRLHFIEINVLPSLEDGSSLYVSGALAGLPDMSAVLDRVVQSASERFGLSPLRARRRTNGRGLRVGLTFNLRRSDKPSEQADADAEHDSPNTIRAIGEALASYGHTVVELEATPELPSLLSEASVDLVFNIAEGFKGRNRESQIPALLELLGIVYTGSDPTALSLSLDKGLAKRLVRQAGFATPPFFLITTGKERLPRDFRFPAIVKPVAEGSSKGILEASVVHDEAELRRVARETALRYRQAAMAESYVGGREFTVGLLGERRPRVLPPMEIVFTDPRETHPIYSFRHKFAGGPVSFQVPARVDAALEKELARVARGAFAALGCRDVARVDLRLDEKGRVHFIECNPLPGLTPGFSDLCVIAEAAGMDFRALIGEILSPAVRRWREGRRELKLAVSA